MKQRTEERLEIARAKENYWKLHRGEGGGDKERCNAWKKVKECIASLEERGNWIEKGGVEGEETRSAEGEDDRKANDDNDLRLSAKLTAKKIMVESKEENSEETKLVLSGGKEHEIKEMEKEWEKEEDVRGKGEGVASSLKKNGLGIKDQGLGTFRNMQNDICTTGVKTRIRDYERMLNTGVSLKGDEDMRFER